jgi:hypothetical protein
MDYQYAAIPADEFAGRFTKRPYKTNELRSVDIDTINPLNRWVIIVHMKLLVETVMRIEI